jgi:DNA-directed RNA polymerase specialized sigma24 family protein
MSPLDTHPGGDSGRFPATQHSVIIGLRSGDETARERARDQIAQVYWRPVYKYLRLKWNREPDDARDLAQGFFLQVFEKDFFAGYDSQRARFRTFLRTCLDRFVQREDTASARQKRGGDAQFLSLDTDLLEAELASSSAKNFPSPEDLFDTEWVQSLLGRSVMALESHCLSEGKELAFGLFRAHDLSAVESGERPSYASLAETHGVTSETVTNHLAYARREFRRITLELLRSMTASEEEFRDEARSLLGIKL